MITRQDVLKGREVAAPLTPEQEANLTTLLDVANKLEGLIGRPLVVTSGYRPPNINASVGGSKKSAHMSCQALDFRDPDGYIDAWLYSRRSWLHEQLGIYQEHPDYTSGWAHVQIRPIKSGNRVFIP